MVGGPKIPRSGVDDRVTRCDRRRPSMPSPRLLGPTARSTYGHHYRRSGELHVDRPLLRGPRLGPAGRAAARMAAGQPLLGAPDTRAAEFRASCDRIRPPRLRPLEPADDGI